MPIFSATDETISNNFADHPGYRSGIYYPFFKNISTDTNSTGGVVANFISYYPATIEYAVNLARLAVYCAGSVANSTLKIGIYKNTNKLPGQLLVDSGDIITATVGAKEAVISLPINPGKYWLGLITLTNPPNLYTSVAFLGTNYEIGQISPTSISANCGLRNSVAGPFNSMPQQAPIDNFTYLTGNIRPLVWFKTA
jgi:hypothetical protein